MSYPPKPAKPRPPHTAFGALPPRPLFTEAPKGRGHKPVPVEIKKVPPGRRKKAIALDPKRGA